MNHGSYAMYTHGRCRCTPCRKANTDYKHLHRTVLRAEAKRGLPVTSPDVRHGRDWIYNLGCRCTPCRYAASAARTLRRTQRQGPS